MLQKLRKKDQKGFTLIELMIVIAIIGILAAIAIPNFLAYRTRGQNSAAQSAAKNFYNQALAYFADGNTGTITAADGALGGTYNPGDNISCGGTIRDDGTGSITVSSLTFKHDSSATTYTVQSDGDLSAS
jgi:type IV pilus assembly protein PilA